MSKIVNKDREATVLVAKCQNNKKPYGIRMEKKVDGKWHCTWAFKITEKAASIEKYKDEIISGEVVLDQEYPGCPYCGFGGWFTCNCGKVTCWDGTQNIPCAWCGNENVIEHSDKIKDMKGTGM